MDVLFLSAYPGHCCRPDITLNTFFVLPALPRATVLWSPVVLSYALPFLHEGLLYTKPIAPARFEGALVVPVK